MPASYSKGETYSLLRLDHFNFAMKIIHISIIAVGTFLILTSLVAGEKALSIVPKGDASVGLSTFIDKGCYKCHIVGKTKLPELAIPAKLSIQLGGNEHRSWTRDQFAQAIMNPNHTIAPEYHIAKIVSGDKLGAENSTMLDFNEILKIKDLINLTTFLESIQR